MQLSLLCLRKFGFFIAELFYMNRCDIEKLPDPTDGAFSDRLKRSKCGRSLTVSTKCTVNPFCVDVCAVVRSMSEKYLVQL